jgi:hypothetical protein
VTSQADTLTAWDLKFQICLGYTFTPATLVNYGLKKYYRIGTRAHRIHLFTFIKNVCNKFEFLSPPTNIRVGGKEPSLMFVRKTKSL